MGNEPLNQPLSGGKYRYVIVGGGLAGASAVEGIRELDPDGPILLLGGESRLPYNRPPLSKGLWTGKEQIHEIFIHDEAFYADAGVEVALGATVTDLDVRGRRLRDDQGRTSHYEKLLLATGGFPRRLDIPGADLDGITHYRTLSDYQKLQADARPGASAVVIGGGFIGSEMAAALSMSGVAVTMVFPGPYPSDRVFPESLGRAIQAEYLRRGVKILAGDEPVAFERSGSGIATRTKSGHRLVSDIVVVGIGMTPATDLAAKAGLAVDNGITVDPCLRTSAPDVYAAGDNANYPSHVLGRHVRTEHWDNALNQGKLAGRNMAGAEQPYTCLPFFFSDLFDFGYEAVGDIDSRLETFADWQEENRTGVIYYMKDGQVRGVMLCNVWEKVDAARGLIETGAGRSVEDLRGAIR